MGGESAKLQRGRLLVSLRDAGVSDQHGDGSLSMRQARSGAFTNDRLRKVGGLNATAHFFSCTNLLHNQLQWQAIFERLFACTHPNRCTIEQLINDGEQPLK
jgi:hypothetical protein